MFDISPQIVWIIIAVIFAVIEGITLGFVTIWFTIGAVAAAIAAASGATTSMQVSIFVIASTILIIVTRPLAEKKLRIGKEKTNVAAMSGRPGVITEDIPPHGSGLAKVGGQMWTAILEDETDSLVAGTEIVVQSVQGVKLIVKRREINE